VHLLDLVKKTPRLGCRLDAPHYALEEFEAEPILGVGQSRLIAGCDTARSREAPLTDPVTMMARNASIWRRLKRIDNTSLWSAVKLACYGSKNSRYCFSSPIAGFGPPITSWKR
jgi:hypothetical protein